VSKTRLLRARFQMRDALAPGIDGSWFAGKQEYEKGEAVVGRGCAKRLKLKGPLRIQ